MGNEIVKVNSSAPAVLQVTPDTVKKYLCPIATDQEIALFINQCQMFSLNPFKREIYLIKYSAKDPATFVVGYESYLKRAERSQKWAGLESGTEGEGDALKAWAKVYRQDWKTPLYHEVFLSEYIQYRNVYQDKPDEGSQFKKIIGKQPTKFWAEKPKTMLKKVAICQAFRMAFPDEMGGMPYTAEEMPVDHSKLVEGEVIPEEITAPAQMPNDTPKSDAPKSDAPKAEDRFSHLDKIKKAKTELHKLTKNDEAYYSVLASFRVNHADEVPVKERLDLIKALKDEWRQQSQLFEEEKRIIIENAADAGVLV
jgi:phage recombination protein Bet